MFILFKNNPKPLVDEYWLHNSIDNNSGFLSLTRTEYIRDYSQAGSISPSGTDSILHMLIDKDPFLEFYKTNHDGNGFYNDNGIDTPRINEIIRKGELEKYFERLK